MGLLIIKLLVPAIVFPKVWLTTPQQPCSCKAV